MEDRWLEDRLRDEPSPEDQALEPTSSAVEEVRRSIPFQVFVDEAPSQTEPIRQVITSASQYRAVVGHAPPVSIQWSREWVVFYGAGVKPTAGYDARIDSIGLERTGRLRVVTTLVAPGPDCVTATVITNPQVFAKLRRPMGATGAARFLRRQETRRCAECAGAATPNPQTGLCECNALGLCVPGYVWNSDPNVCGCVRI